MSKMTDEVHVLNQQRVELSKLLKLANNNLSQLANARKTAVEIQKDSKDSKEEFEMVNFSLEDKKTFELDQRLKNATAIATDPTEEMLVSAAVTYLWSGIVSRAYSMSHSAQDGLSMLAKRWFS